MGTVSAGARGVRKCGAGSGWRMANTGAGTCVSVYEGWISMTGLATVCSRKASPHTHHALHSTLDGMIVRLRYSRDPGRLRHQTAQCLLSHQADGSHRGARAATCVRQHHLFESTWGSGVRVGRHSWGWQQNLNSTPLVPIKQCPSTHTAHTPHPKPQAHSTDTPPPLRPPPHAHSTAQHSTPYTDTHRVGI
jgi:hypothetical protein